MFKIKDRYTLGCTVGIIANLIRNILNNILYYLGFTKYLPRQLAAATFFPSSEVDNPSAIVVGIFADYGVAALFGLMAIYLLYHSGMDYLWFKGATLGLLFWLIAFGIFLLLGFSRINPIDAGTNITFLFNHIFLGLITVWIADKYGGNALKDS